MNQIKSEKWYVWREFAQVEGEVEPRLLTPWANPDIYEYDYNFVFATAEEAQTHKQENAPEENWILCEMILNPILPIEQVNHE